MKIIKRITLLSIIMAIVMINISYGFSVAELSGTTVVNADALNWGQKLITVISTVGSVLSVVILIVIGIKYMVGGIEEKAQYKKTLMPYVIGCILVFAASTVVGVVYQVSPK